MISKYGTSVSLMNRANNLCAGQHFAESTTSSTDFPTLGFEISQISNNFLINDMTDNSGDTTNAGYLMLAPSNAITTRQTIKNGLDSNGIRIGLAGSADKANNSPAPVSCKETDETNGYDSVSGGIKYNCSTFIQLPNPRGAVDNSRNPDYSFIRLSLPYIESDVQFEISFHGDSNVDSVLNMKETQYLVSVNGKTGERVRRTEAYIGGMSNDAIVPLWSASIRGTGEVSKCKAVGGATSACELDNTKDAKIMDYKTLKETTTINYTCTFNFVTKDAFGNAITPPSEADLSQKCNSDGARL
jgi:hypothetical protein